MTANVLRRVWLGGRRVLRPKGDAILVFKACVIGGDGNSFKHLQISNGKGGSELTVERPTPMKLACASGLLHRDLDGGELTQLEFLDLCAREWACDGVVLDVAHFPRMDDDYLAQVKKMAADRGLCLAALADAGFFFSEKEHMTDVLAAAVRLGAPLVAGPLAREIDCSWSDQLERLGEATRSAKAANVTLAVRNAPGTFAASTHDCKRVAKEADSAWLRFGPEPAELDAASDLGMLQPNTVLLWSDVAVTERSIATILAAFSDFRGHLVLDNHSGEATGEAIQKALRSWRAALNRR